VLIYDASENDFLGFLCVQGYNKTQIATMTGNSSPFVCPDDKGSVTNLNYPFITVPIDERRFGRSVYHANVTSVPGITVNVSPNKLIFSESEKKMNFMVSISGSPAPVKGKVGASASIVWSDGMNQVRSTIYVFPLSAIGRY
jgi:hypothetical protein